MSDWDVYGAEADDVIDAEIRRLVRRAGWLDAALRMCAGAACCGILVAAYVLTR